MAGRPLRRARENGKAEIGMRQIQTRKGVLRLTGTGDGSFWFEDSTTREVVKVTHLKTDKLEDLFDDPESSGWVVAKTARGSKTSALTLFSSLEQAMGFLRTM